jgi:hypothetical protein
MVRQIFRTRYRPLIRALAARFAHQRLSPVSIVGEFAAHQARLRAEAPPIPSVTRKLWDRAARRLPRAIRRQRILRLSRQAFDAMDRAFLEERT